MYDKVIAYLFNVILLGMIFENRIFVLGPTIYKFLQPIF